MEIKKEWHGIQNWETIGGMKEINLNILYDGTKGTRAEQTRDSIRDLCVQFSWETEEVLIYNCTKDQRQNKQEPKQAKGGQIYTLYCI